MRLFLKKTLCAATAMVFWIMSLPAFASRDAINGVLSLSKPGSRVHLSPAFNPPVLKGIKVHPDNPMNFEFVMDVGAGLAPAQNNRATARVAHTDLKSESQRLIKYFLASITTSEKDMWVNLSPYEKERIVPESFGQTEMGRDLLVQDYMLKQITASLIYPEDEIGKKFWKRVYEEAANKFGTTNIPVNTFNKVWIVPDKAVVYENAKAGTAYVVESRLKVMLEEDYLAMDKNNVGAGLAPAQDNRATARVAPTGINQLGSQIVREIVIPALTKEVNQGQNFAKLRQVYNSLILATWYKTKIKNSILNHVYANMNKIKGIEYERLLTRGHVQDRTAKNVSPSRLPSDEAWSVKATQRNEPNDVEVIYQQYLQAFKKGAYNYIKEEMDPVTQQMIPRKYFSGGLDMALTSSHYDLQAAAYSVTGNPAMVQGESDRAVIVQVKIQDSAQTALFRVLSSQGKYWHEIEFSRVSGLVSSELERKKREGDEIKDVNGGTIQVGRNASMFHNLIDYAADQKKEVDSIELLILMIRVFNAIGTASGVTISQGIPNYSIRKYVDKFMRITKAESLNEVEEILKEIMPALRQAGQPITDEFKKNAGEIFMIKEIPKIAALKDGREIDLIDLGLPAVQENIKVPIVIVDEKIPTLYSSEKLLTTADGWMSNDFRYRIAVSKDGDIYFIKRSFEGGQFSVMYPFRLDYEDAGKILSSDIMSKIPTQHHSKVQTAIAEAYKKLIVDSMHPDPRLTNLLVKITLDDKGVPTFEFEPIDYEMRDRAQTSGGTSRRDVLRGILGIAVSSALSGCAFPDTQDINGKSRVLSSKIEYLTPFDQKKPIILFIHGAEKDPHKMVNKLKQAWSTSHNILLFNYIADIDKDTQHVAQELIQQMQPLRTWRQTHAMRELTIVTNSFGAIVFRRAVLGHGGGIFSGANLFQFALVSGGLRQFALKGPFVSREWVVLNLAGKYGYVAWNLIPNGEGQRELFENEVDARFRQIIDPKKMLSALPEHDRYRDEHDTLYAQNAVGINNKLVKGAEHDNVMNTPQGQDIFSQYMQLIQKDGDLQSISDKAMVRDVKGGIDFNANKLNLDVKNGGQGLEFQMDPAMVKQLENVPGFVPVIINIQPLTNLKIFLGITS